MYKEEDCGCHGHTRYHGEFKPGQHSGYGEEHVPKRSGLCEHYWIHHGWHNPVNRGCGCHEYRGTPGMHYGCRCECHGHQAPEKGFVRRFVTRSEIITGLEDYRKQLQEEIKGVEERIAELKHQGEESHPA